MESFVPSYFQQMRASHRRMPKMMHIALGSMLWGLVTRKWTTTSVSLFVSRICTPLWLAEFQAPRWWFCTLCDADEIGSGMSRLKNLAMGLQEEIDEQNELIDKVTDKVSVMDIKLKNAEGQIHKLWSNCKMQITQTRICGVPNWISPLMLRKDPKDPCHFVKGRWFVWDCESLWMSENYYYYHWAPCQHSTSLVRLSLLISHGNIYRAFQARMSLVSALKALHSNIASACATEFWGF